MPLSTTATVTCWPLVRSHTLLKSSARCAQGSLVRCDRPRCDTQLADGFGIPRTGSGGPGGAACCVDGGTAGPVGLADRDGFGDEVGAGDGAASPARPGDWLADVVEAPATSVKGTSVTAANAAARTTPANRLIRWPPGDRYARSPQETLETSGYGRRKTWVPPRLRPWNTIMAAGRTAVTGIGRLSSGRKTAGDLAAKE